MAAAVAAAATEAAPAEKGKPFALLLPPLEGFFDLELLPWGWGFMVAL